MVKGEKVCEELHLRIPHCCRFKDSSMRISIVGVLTLSLVRNGMYSQEKLVSVCKSAKLRIFKSRGGGLNLKILTNEGAQLIKDIQLPNAKCGISKSL